jgi:hypothetical protein
VVVRADALVEGYGCGEGDAEVFKYAAVVSLDGVIYAGGVFDCFADAKFANLTPSASGASVTYTVQIYGYSRAAYLAQADALQAARSALDAVQGPSTNADARLKATRPSFVASCSATSQDVEVPAVCPMLSPAGASAGG